jgi:hypothetical protein
MNLVACIKVYSQYILRVLLGFQNSQKKMALSSSRAMEISFGNVRYLSI